MKINKVLVIIPYGKLVFSNNQRKIIYEMEYFNKLYNIIFDTIVAYNNNIKCYKSIVKWGEIKSDIVHKIFYADIVIAIATGRSSDVFWQLGIRHALKKGTIILQDIRDETPLGIVGYSSIQYQLTNTIGIKNLKNILIEKISNYEESPFFDSPVHNILKKDLTDLLQLNIEKFDLFISYSTKYSKEALNILEAAERKGLSVFLDKKDIKYGSEFTETIRYSLLKSKNICVLITPEALKSEWVITEWGAAWVLKKRITPILLNCSVSDLPDRLKMYQYVEYENLEKYINQLYNNKNNE